MECACKGRRGHVPMIVMACVLILSGCEGKPPIIEDKCGSCHSTSRVYQKKRSMDEWDQIMFGMKARGLKVSPEEEQEIMDVLKKRYSTK